MDNLKDLLKQRRSRYSLAAENSLTNDQLKELIDYAVTHVPSAFNSQSARTVLLLNDEHRKLWKIVENVLSEVVPAEAFEKTRTKINNCFACGYGTVLFYEDQSIIRDLQENFPTYSDNFPVWSNQSSAMHQYAVWLLLEEAGMGASLQHYNPLIDSKVAEEWNIDPNWKLIAQMPFGIAIDTPGEKEFHPLETRSLVYR